MSRRDLTNFPMLAFLATGLCVATPAHAYIGPGAGLGAIAVTAALGFGVILLLFGLVWYPLKRLLKRNKPDAAAEDTRN